MFIIGSSLGFLSPSGCHPDAANLTSDSRDAYMHQLSIYGWRRIFFTDWLLKSPSPCLNPVPPKADDESFSSDDHATRPPLPHRRSMEPRLVDVPHGRRTPRPPVYISIGELVACLQLMYACTLTDFRFTLQLRNNTTGEIPFPDGVARSVSECFAWANSLSPSSLLAVLYQVRLLGAGTFGCVYGLAWGDDIVLAAKTTKRANAPITETEINALVRVSQSSRALGRLRRTAATLVLRLVNFVGRSAFRMVKWLDTTGSGCS